MKTDNFRPGFAYLRLSNEEAAGGESASITNQRMIVRSYCERSGIRLVREFVDDGYSGGNFDRPGFQAMLRQLERGEAELVITKDLSRLGRDMREASYYAEQFFPERGVRYIAITDNFDTERENVMAPFLFAMNEVYLRDGSRKVREVLRGKREAGQYCACPPYGYRKDEKNRQRLTPDAMTAPVVERIFQQAAAGDSSRKIAQELSRDGVIPPLKYRVLYRDQFGEAGASRASDGWNYTTVKRILKNPVYLGHTLLGKTRKASVKSQKTVALPREAWAVTENTHPPLVSEALYARAQANLGRGAWQTEGQETVRRSMFAGIVVCGRCGGALCSGGTVYKGEREKYWYLSCTHQRRDVAAPCAGVRIRYADLVELVREDLNALLSLTEAQMEALVETAVKRLEPAENGQTDREQKDRARARIQTIDHVIARLYTDNAEGRLDEGRLRRMVEELERESAGLQAMLERAARGSEREQTQAAYARFFALARQYTDLKQLDRQTLETFVEKIEVGPKERLEGEALGAPRARKYRQNVRIFYRFVGEIADGAEENPDAPHEGEL